MKSIHKYWLVAGVLFATVSGCEDENQTSPDGGAATGGTGGSGAAGKAGASGTSGASGSGGTGGGAGTGGGGTGGAAGTAGKGGAAGTAGASGGTGTGGMAGSAGAAGSAGTAGSGGNDGGLPDSGTGGTAGGTPDAGPPDTSVDASDGGFTLPPFTPPANPGKGGILFSASGETLALTGFPYPPASPDDLQFYDGWEVTFDRLIVTIDNLTISANPDTDMGDQSKTGAVMASAKGPWAVDLHRDGPGNIPGKSPGERAVPIAAMIQSDGPFLTNGTRYAFGFDGVAASAQAKNVNLDPAALADYGEMVQNACTAFYVGTATFKGDTTCNAGHTNWPTPVKFRLCFKTPVTYINCQNPENMGTPFPNEESQRGIAFDANAAVIAQVTFHAEHPFWDSVLHDSPSHFDQFAARVVGQDGGIPTVTLEHTKGVDYTAYRDGLNNAIQWRYCTEPPTTTHPKFTGPMAFDPQSVPRATGSDPKTGLRDYYDFAQYNESTEGHLNADGLCFVRRNYDSPP